MYTHEKCVSQAQTQATLLPIADDVGCITYDLHSAEQELAAVALL